MVIRFSMNSEGKTRSDVRCYRDRGIEGDSQVLGSSNWKDRLYVLLWGWLWEEGKKPGGNIKFGMHIRHPRRDIK